MGGNLVAEIEHSSSHSSGRGSSAPAEPHKVGCHVTARTYLQFTSFQGLVFVHNTENSKKEETPHNA